MLATFLFVIPLFMWANGNFSGQSNADVSSKKSFFKLVEGATVGKPFKYDFAPELIPLLETGSSAPYSFHLGSGVGFPPMGLNLDPFSGVLSGIPKGVNVNTFEVCVKDVGGRSACRTYTMPVTSKSGKTLTPASTPTPTSNTNVVQGTVRTEKWVGTYNSHNVGDFGDGTGCTRDTSAPISLCLTWKGQNFEGPIDFPGGYKDTYTPRDSNSVCLPMPVPRCGFEEGGGVAGCGDISGYIDPSGNLKIDALSLEMSLSYDPNYNPVTSAVMVGNSVTVEYYHSGVYGGESQSNKGSFTATKVSDSCK